MKKTLFDNNWFVGLISLFFAIVVVVSIANENNTLASLALNNNSASIESSVTISNVPVNLGEHDEGTFISGMPETVSVRISGPRNIINQISIEHFSVQTESLVGVKEGVRAIRFEVIGLPEQLEYKVTPDLFYGTVSTKATVVKPIEYEIMDGTVASNAQVTKVSIKPQEVTLSGSQSEIDKVAKVLVQITANEPQVESFTQKYRVQVLDSDNKPLDVNVSQEEVSVSVAIESTERLIPLTIVPIGEDPALNYQYLFVSANNVAISGANSSSIESLNVLVDVTNLTESQTITGTIEAVDGITLSTSAVEIAVTINALQSETVEPLNEETTVESTIPLTEESLETTSENNETTEVE